MGPCRNGRAWASTVTGGHQRFRGTAACGPFRSASRSDAGGRFGLWSRRAGVRVPSVTPQVAGRVAEVITGVRALTRPAPRSCRRVRSLDIEDSGTDSAHSDDDAFASFGDDRLAVDQARRDVDEITLADHDQLAAPRPKLNRHPTTGDVAVGGIVPM